MSSNRSVRGLKIANNNQTNVRHGNTGIQIREIEVESGDRIIKTTEDQANLNLDNRCDRRRMDSMPDNKSLFGTDNAHLNGPRVRALETGDDLLITRMGGLTITEVDVSNDDNRPVVRDSLSSSEPTANPIRYRMMSTVTSVVEPDNVRCQSQESDEDEEDSQDDDSDDLSEVPDRGPTMGGRLPRASKYHPYGESAQPMSPGSSSDSSYHDSSPGSSPPPPPPSGNRSVPVPTQYVLGRSTRLAQDTGGFCTYFPTALTTTSGPASTTVTASEILGSSPPSRINRQSNLQSGGHAIISDRGRHQSGSVFDVVFDASSPGNTWTPSYDTASPSSAIVEVQEWTETLPLPTSFLQVRETGDFSPASDAWSASSPATTDDTDLNASSPEYPVSPETAAEVAAGFPHFTIGSPPSVAAAASPSEGATPPISTSFDSIYVGDCSSEQQASATSDLDFDTPLDLLPYLNVFGDGFDDSFVDIPCGAEDETLTNQRPPSARPAQSSRPLQHFGSGQTHGLIQPAISSQSTYSPPQYVPMPAAPQSTYTPAQYVPMPAAPQSGYAAAQSAGFVSPQSGYVAPQPGHAVSLSGYTPNHSVYSTSQSGYTQSQPGYAPPRQVNVSLPHSVNATAYLSGQPVPTSYPRQLSPQQQSSPAGPRGTASMPIQQVQQQAMQGPVIILVTMPNTPKYRHILPKTSEGASTATPVRTLATLAPSSTSSERQQLQQQQYTVSQYGAMPSTSAVSNAFMLPNAREKLRATLNQIRLDDACKVVERQTAEQLQQSDRADGDTDLHISTANGNNEYTYAIVERFKRENLSINKPNKHGQTPLFNAVSNNNPLVVSYLLQNKADASCVCKDNSTPLHVVAGAGQGFLGVGRLLCQVPNVCLNGTNSEGFTPLHRAVMKHSDTVNNLPIIELLLQSGANMDVVDLCGGRTALYMAVERGSNDMVSVICRFCPNISSTINFSTYTKDNPLHAAARLNHLDEEIQIVMLETLLRYGAERHSKNKENKFPKDLVDKRHPKAKKILQWPRNR